MSTGQRAQNFDICSAQIRPVGQPDSTVLHGVDRVLVGHGPIVDATILPDWRVVAADGRRLRIADGCCDMVSGEIVEHDHVGEFAGLGRLRGG